MRGVVAQVDRVKQFCKNAEMKNVAISPETHKWLRIMAAKNECGIGDLADAIIADARKSGAWINVALSCDGTKPKGKK